MEEKRGRFYADVFMLVGAIITWFCNGRLTLYVWLFYVFFTAVRAYICCVVSGGWFACYTLILRFT